MQTTSGGGTTEKKKTVVKPTNTSSAYNQATNVNSQPKKTSTFSNLNTTKTLNVKQNKTTTNNPTPVKTTQNQPQSAYNQATKPATSFFDTYKQSLGQNNTVKPTTKTRNDFGSDNDYEDYLYQNKVDLTKGDAFNYVSGKAKETGIHPRDYAGDMYYKAKNRQETNQTLAKETEARNNRIANNKGYEERLYSISDEKGNSMSLSDYKNNVSTFENDYTTLQNDAKALSDKFNVDKNYAEYIAGYDALLKREQELQERYNNLSTYSKVSYNESYSQKYEENLQKIQELTAQSRLLRAQGNLEAIKPLSEEISRLQAENATISDLKNDVQSLQETDYYNYLKENGSEQEILDFERLMSHKDDNVAERLFNSFSTQTFGMLYQSTLDLYDIAKDLGGEVIGSLTETAVNALNSKGLIDDETLDNLEKVASDLKSFDWTADDNYSQVIRKWRQTSGYENMYGAGEMERNIVETLSGSGDSVARYKLFGHLTTAVSGFVAATDKYIENINNGYSPEVAMANASVIGVINMLSEMLPTENWIRIANNKAFEYIGSGLARVGAAIISQGFEETLETTFEEGGDYITDYITYTLFGNSEEQKPHFERDDLLRACMISFASGGLVGGLEMGKNVAIDTYNKNQAFKTLLSNNIGKITSLEEKNAMVEAIGELEWCLNLSNDKVINKNIELVKSMAEEKIQEFENSSVLAKSVKTVGKDVEANINATIQENINFEAQALAPELINGAKQQELNDIQVAKNESFISAVETVKKVNDYATLSMMSDYGVNMDPKQYRQLDADVRENVNIVSKYAKRLNVDVAFDDNLNNMTVQADYGLRQSGVNGYNNKGQIVLNPNTVNPQTVVLVHEITHNLEYSKYYGSLSELIKNSEGYEQIYNQAARTYEGIGNIENEANAIYMEKNFGNENFIKRIIRYNESLAYRIFKDIQSMVSSDEKTLIENAWAKAFKDVQNIELNNIVSYSVDELNTKKILSDYGITDEELSNGNVVARKIYDRLVAMKNSFISTEDRTILIVNKETGKEFIVSKAAIDETFGKPTTFFHKSKKRKRAMIAVADKIGYFIENGKVIKDNVKNYHNENGSPYIYIGHPVNIEGTDYYVTLMLKYSRDGNRLHIYKMDLAEKIGPLSKAISEDSPGFSEPKNNISQIGNNVKRSLDDNLAYHYNDGTTFDNSTYGSVIYDIKPNTVKYSLSEKKRSLNSNKQSIKNYLTNILGVNFNRTYLNTTKLLNELTEQIATTGEYNQETYNNFKNAIWEAMKVRRGNEAYDPSKIRSFLKDNPILRSQVEAADKRYLASNFGAFTFSNKGTSFDTLMAEFNELFPGLINPNEINSARDFIDAVQAQIYQLDSAKNDYVVPDVEFNMSAEELYKFFESKLDDAMGIYADDIKNLNEKYKTYDEKVNDVLKLINNPNVTADTFNKINNYEAITNAEFEGIKDAKDILLNNVDKWIKNYDVVKEQFGMFDNDTISNICYDIMMNGEISADTKDKMLNSLSSDQTFEGADTDINEQAEMIGDEIANLLYEKATGTKAQNDTPEDTMAKYQGNIEQYGAFAPGATPRQDIQVPKATEHGPTSQFARNVAETPGIISDDKSMEILANAVNNGELSYKALTNKALMDDAAKKLNMRGLDTMYNEVINNHNLNARTFTEEMTVLTELAKIKDYDRMKTVYLKLQDEATTMGQGLQTFTLLKKMSPEVQLMAAEKMMERMQNELDQQYGNKAVKLEIPENLKNNLLNAETEEEQAKARSAIQKELLNQQPKKLGDILNAWRYLSMLGNPRTHIRNILGNALFSPLVDIKNTIATGIENLVGSKLEHKTKAIVGFSKEDMALKQLGKEHYRTAILVNDQKYETKNFGNSKLGNLLNKLSNANSTAMDKEDFIFSSSRFAQSFASYIKSNGYTAENVPQDVLSKAVDYATLEAQKATYRDFNAGAEWLNKAEKSKSKLLRLSKQALVPFTKTPMNIIRRGVEYSPLGLMKTITADAYNLSQGKIDANTFIDNLSAGMTGTMISILGATLASIGIFRTKDDDKDRKQMFDEDNGEQDYCIDLSPFGIEGTYTIDWATPDIMPLAIGAELYDIFMKSEGIDGFEDTMDAVATISAKVFDPIFDTSMLSSLQSALKSYANGGGEWVGNIVGSMVSSYILQFIPTLSGQIARAVDDTRRTTYPNTGLIDKTIKQALNKIPGLSILNEPYINRSGEEEKNTGGNFFGRLIYNMVSPGYYQNKEIDKYDEEYYRLYESTGLLDAFPSSSVTSTTYDKEQYKLTDKEYTEWNKTRWSLEKEMVNDFIDSESYQYYSDEERVETIKDIRTYAQKVAKEKLLNGRGVEYTDANYEKLKNIAENMDIKDYFNYNNFSGTKQAEKIEYLENSDLSQKEKELLYSTEGYKTSYADAYAKVFGESKTNRSTKTSKTTNKTSTKKTSIKVPTTKTTKQTAYTQGTKVNTQNVNTSDYFTYRYNFLKSAAQPASQGGTKVVCPVCGQSVIPVDGKCPVCGASL